MARMQRFTQRARKVLSLSQRFAEANETNIIDTGHLLLALAHQDNGVAMTVLQRMNLQIEQIEPLVKELSVSKSPHVILSTDIEKMLTYSVDAARGMWVDHIGTEHFLLALFKFQSGMVYEIFKLLNINPDDGMKLTRALVRAARRAYPPDVKLDDIEGHITYIDENRTLLGEIGRWLGLRENKTK